MSTGSTCLTKNKKILYIENQATARASNFYIAALQASKLMGWDFHLTYKCLDYNEQEIDDVEKNLELKFHNIDFYRNPIHPGNIKAFHQLNKLIMEEQFDVIHCNTPVGGVLGRIAAKRNKTANVLYQAHGFHFFEGAPLLNWLLYYPVEKILARITDVIITINKEDYLFALKHLRPRSKVYYVPGVGIELDKWNTSCDLRSEFGFDDDDFLILVVGRLEKNKNCLMIIDAISEIDDENVKLVFCGDGEDRQILEERSRKLGKRVRFLGNQNNMPGIYHMADCFVLASFREGLSRSIMEAMACGLPCVVSDIRGNGDLIDEQGGFLFSPYKTEALRDNIAKLYKSKELRQQMKIHNLKKIKQFSLSRVVNEIVKIYKDIPEY